MAAAEAEAIANGWPMAIAIVDPAGRLVLFLKLDGTANGSVEVALGKARTAALFRRPTKVFEDAIAGGGKGLRILSMPDVLALEGGVPIFQSGAVIGGIGVSGMQSGQDAQVAQAGADAAGG
jgi:glc operon protein GlcG